MNLVFTGAGKVFVVIGAGGAGKAKQKLICIWGSIPPSSRSRKLLCFDAALRNSYLISYCPKLLDTCLSIN
ncbi:unnamed protein product [Lupinus luteus]|uniref:Uncharacterized protein n=1 Tax=Lupinus luteus TaxID=3873 RepID=A0AAV1X650_LUPLU